MSEPGSSGLLAGGENKVSVGEKPAGEDNSVKAEIPLGTDAATTR